MPDTVLNFARTKADASNTWSGASPVEEYTLTYSTGDASKDVTLVVAQWTQQDAAKTQYDALASAMTGKELGSGNVKVSGEWSIGQVANFYPLTKERRLRWARSSRSAASV